MPTEQTLRRREYQRAYYQATKERQKANRKPAADRRGEHLKLRYGLTPERYDTMLVEQLGGCAICGREPKKARLHVDHDHACCPGSRSCGECVRGLLCAPCNGALHYLESARWVEAATAYLEKFCQPC